MIKREKSFFNGSEIEFDYLIIPLAQGIPTSEKMNGE